MSWKLRFPLVTSEHLTFFPQEIQDKVISPEKAEEAKLKARYPNLGCKPGGSDLLRKRLQKGVSHPSWVLLLFFYLTFRDP